MSVAWVVLLAAITAAVLAAAVSMSRSSAIDPIDPEAEERWIVARLRRFPRLATFVRRRLDRDAAGGLLLTVAFVVVFVTALLVGLLFDMVDRQEGLAEFDESVAEWGASQAGTRGAEIMEQVTELGGTPVLAVVLVVIGVAEYVRTRRRDTLLFLLAVGVGQLLLSNGIKWIVDRDRPDVLQLTGASGSSFPSGHSTAAAACWAAVALVLSRHGGRGWRAVAAGVAACIAVAVAASRAMLGVHWLTDIVAGLVLGWGWFILVAVAFGGFRLRLGEPAERVGATAPPERTAAYSGRELRAEP